MIFTSGLLHCFTQLSSFIFWQSLRCFAVLGHFDSITARFFGVPAARFHLFCFVFFCFMNKYDSRLLKCLFLSTSPIASSRVCWACIIASSVLKLCKCLTLFYMWVCHVLWALRLKSINQIKSIYELEHTLVPACSSKYLLAEVDLLSSCFLSFQFLTL